MLALIAGTGDLPTALVARLPARPLVLALSGFAPQVTPDITFRLENLGSVLAVLKDRGVTEICMAGAIRRPAIDLTLIDAATRPLVPRLKAALGAGDDGALRVVIGLFEEAGFAVRAAHDIAPDLLPPAGIPSRAQPSAAAIADAALGERTVAAMGDIDQGQACVIRDGRVLLREGPAGTDAMLAPYRRSDQPRMDDDNPFAFAFDTVTDLIGDAADWLSGDRPGVTGGILFKAPKPRQDRRADLPVIGPQTAVAAHDARLAGIVIEAGGVMALDLPAILHICDSFGLFLWVRPRGGA